MPRKKKSESEMVPEPVEQPVEVVEPADSPVVEGEGASAVEASGQVIVFTMDGQNYALPIESVQEIQQIVEYTRARGADPALMGMVDLRGAVVPLIDLRALLGLTCAAYHLDTPLVFAHIAERLVAFIVDEVQDVIDLTGMQLQAPSSLYALADRMLGVVRLGETLLFVLDPTCLVPASALPGTDDLSKEVAR